jgi:hypothetical protein
MDQKQGKAVGGDVAPPPPTGPTGPTAQERTVYIIVEERRKRKKKNKGKRGSSRAARRVEDIERDLSRAVRRVARGGHFGANRYIRRRNRSARRRRDGALVDFCKNVARGASKATRVSSPALIDVAKAVESKRTRKGIRRVLRGVPMF